MKAVIFLGTILMTVSSYSQNNPYVAIGRAKTNGIVAIANGMTGGQAVRNGLGGANTTKLEQSSPYGQSSSYESSYSSSESSSYQSSAASNVHLLENQDPTFQLYVYESYKLRAKLNLNDETLDKMAGDNSWDALRNIKDYYNLLAKKVRYDVRNLPVASVIFPDRKDNFDAILEFHNCQLGSENKVRMTIGNGSRVAVTRERIEHYLWRSMVKVIILENTAEDYGPSGPYAARSPAPKGCFGYISSAYLKKEQVKKCN